MAQCKSISEDQAGDASNAPALPIWLRYTTRHAPPPQARSKMLEHIAQRKSVSDKQAGDTTGASPSRTGVAEVVRSFIGYNVFFGFLGILFWPRFPMYLGLLFFFTDDKFIDWVLQKIGTRSDKQAGDTSDALGPSRKVGRDFVRSFRRYMVFFGVIGLLTSSRFPLYLGALIFFTDDDFIDWVLEKIGLRLAPGTLGLIFIRFLVPGIGWLALLGYGRESAPAWLKPWMLAPPPSWSFVGGTALLVGSTALLFATVMTVSAALVRKLLPRFWIQLTSDDLAGSTTRLLIALGVAALLFATLMVPDWLGGH